MSDYELCTDIEIVMELLGITATELANSIGVTPTTISRWRQNEEQISASNLNAFYNFVFSQGIRLNKIKEQLFKEDCGQNSIILFPLSYVNNVFCLLLSTNVNDFPVILKFFQS